MRSVLAALVVGLALPASALGDSLTVDPSSPAPAGSESTFSVTADTAAPASVFLFGHPLGLACGLTPDDESAVAGAIPFNESPYPVGAGTSTFDAHLTAPGPAAICGYLDTSPFGVPTAVATTIFEPSPAPDVPPRQPVDVPDTTPVDTPRTPRTPSPGRIFSRLHSHIFGTQPLPISIGASHRPANGDSGGAAVSGDNRKARLAAFHSSASNLVAGDTNAKTDVFVWQRPRGSAGLTLNRLGGALTRASVSSSGAQTNGDSTNPSLDGSITSVPHCVAFQSTATNLAGGDGDSTSDVYARDLRTRRTSLVSGGVGPAATSPSIDGHCRQVAFQAGGGVWLGSAHGGRAHRFSGGSQPDFSLDGSAIVWTKGGNVWIRRHGVSGKVGPGSHPHVSDDESGIWGVVFDTTRRLARNDHDSRMDVYTRVMKTRGGPSRTDLISTATGGGAFNGGITAYGANRGIIVFGIAEGPGSGLWYRNNHTGNIDDLAFTTQGMLTGVATSARANFVAFTAQQAISPLDRSLHRTVFFKQLVDGESY